jgi:hypothetical protein
VVGLIVVYYITAAVRHIPVFCVRGEVLVTGCLVFGSIVGLATGWIRHGASIQIGVADSWLR